MGHAALHQVVVHAADSHAALGAHGDVHLAGEGGPRGTHAPGGVVDGDVPGVAGGGDKPDVIQIPHTVLGVQGDEAAVAALAHVICIQRPLPHRGVGEGDIAQAHARALLAHPVELVGVEADGGIVLGGEGDPRAGPCLRLHLQGDPAVIGLGALGVPGGGHIGDIHGAAHIGGLHHKCDVLQIPPAPCDLAAQVVDVTAHPPAGLGLGVVVVVQGALVRRDAQPAHADHLASQLAAEVAAQLLEGQRLAAAEGPAVLNGCAGVVYHGEGD